MSNRTYDICKNISVIGVPAVVVFLNTLGDIWGIPYITQISATIGAFGVLLGAIIQKSSSDYAKERSDQ